MRLRRRPEDFIVDEIPRLEPEREGHYGLYRLRKRGLTTPEAVRRVARAACIDTGRVRYSGLKDRHAIATQYITIFGEPLGALSGPGFRLTPVGRTMRAAGPSEIARNRFRITVRDLSAEEAARTRELASRYARAGIPNYFDVQRFGSARATGEFPGEAAARGDYEKAVKLVIAAWSREDSKEVKRRRRVVAGKWGDWRAIGHELDRSTERFIVTYLADHPADFAGAFDRLPEPLWSIVLSAFQSLVWNEMLSAVVRARAPKTWVRRGRYDEVVFFEPDESSTEALRGLTIPFPHRSLDTAERAGDPDVFVAYAEALARHGLTPDSFRLRGLKRARFRRGGRSALAEVADFSAAEPVTDEMDEGRYALVLEFSLPPGAYATMFVKAATGEEEGNTNHCGALRPA